MNITTKIFGLIVVALLLCQGNATPRSVQASLKHKFRVVGYLRDYDIADGKAARFDFNRITHLNIAFINPDSYGNFTALKGLPRTIRAAHAKNVKVFASIGGGLAPAYYANLLAAKNRDGFIEKLVKVAISNNLDGIDVDLEGERIDNNYERFVLDLSFALKQHNKLITAAIATYYQSQYTDKALAQLDFINIMSYDKTGPWKPAKPGPHAPYSMAEEDLNYWTITRGISKDKLNLGVPFYGYGFGQNAPSEITYRELLKRYPDALYKDQINTHGGVVYYNGRQTIKAKTRLALKKSGGIMVWQLLQDADGKESLLDLINNQIGLNNK